MESPRTEAEYTAAGSARWTGPIANLNAALAQVETACNAIVAQALEVEADAAVAARQASQRIADIESTAEAAVQRTRLQNEIELGELRSVIERLTRKLNVHERFERGLAWADDSDAGEEMAAALTGEGAERDARSQVLALRAELEASRAEIAELTRRVDTERAKHARLIEAIRSVKRTDQPGIRLAAPVGERPPAAAREEPAAAIPVVAEPQAATVPVGDPGRDFDASEYALRLLDQIESMYEADTMARLPFDELLERLTANLRYASNAFARRLGESGPGTEVFDRQLTIRMDEKSDTLFGRHLAIAAYEYRRPEDGDQAQVA